MRPGWGQLPAKMGSSVSEVTKPALVLKGHSRAISSLAWLGGDLIAAGDCPPSTLWSGTMVMENVDPTVLYFDDAPTPARRSTTSSCATSISRRRGQSPTYPNRLHGLGGRRAMKAQAASSSAAKAASSSIILS